MSASFCLGKFSLTNPRNTSPMTSKAKASPPSPSKKRSKTTSHPSIAASSLTPTAARSKCSRIATSTSVPVRIVSGPSVATMLTRGRARPAEAR